MGRGILGLVAGMVAGGIAGGATYKAGRGMARLISAPVRAYSNTVNESKEFARLAIMERDEDEPFESSWDRKKRLEAQAAAAIPPKVDKYAEFDLDMLAKRHANAKAAARQREAQAQEPWRVESAKEMSVILNRLDAIQAEKAAKAAAKAAKKAARKGFF